MIWTRRVAWLAPLMIAACSSPGRLIGPPPGGDGSPTQLDAGQQPGDQGSSQHDTTEPEDSSAPQSDSAPPKPDAAPPVAPGCSPLPQLCACAQACNAGKCDNSNCPCQPIPGETYGKIGTINPYGGDPSTQADMNLMTRKWKVVPGATKGLVDIAGPGDPTNTPPQLYTMFLDNRVPVFTNLYSIDLWDWGCNCSGGFPADSPVQLAAMKVTPGEKIRAPWSGYKIMPPSYGTMLMYAAPGTVSLKYTPEDSVVTGYTVHIFGICVEPSLLALYNQCDKAGRKELPALWRNDSKETQVIGRAIGNEIIVAIRDTGSWMDPRCRKDWWIGK